MIETDEEYRKRMRKNEIQATYRRKHPDRIKAYQKAYNKAYHKTDKYKAYQKAYRKAYHKTDKYKAYRKERLKQTLDAELERIRTNGKHWKQSGGEHG